MNIRILYDKANKYYKVMDGARFVTSRKTRSEAEKLTIQMQRDLHVNTGFFGAQAYERSWCDECFKVHIDGLCI